MFLFTLVNTPVEVHFSSWLFYLSICSEHKLIVPSVCHIHFRSNPENYFYNSGYKKTWPESSSFVYVTRNCELCSSIIIWWLTLKFWFTIQNALLKDCKHFKLKNKFWSKSRPGTFNIDKLVKWKYNRRICRTVTIISIICPFYIYW